MPGSDTERGRARIARQDVVRVLGWDDADGSGTDVVAITTSTAPRRSFGPRLLTLSRPPGSATRTSVQTTLMGHPAPGIAGWLAPAAPVDAAPAGSDESARGRRSPWRRRSP
jgi:hypothetical protein